jgi:hypothetical protein
MVVLLLESVGHVALRRVVVLPETFDVGIALDAVVLKLFEIVVDRHERILGREVKGSAFDN